MKNKQIIVQIRPLKEVLKEFAEVYGKLQRGEKVKPSAGVSFGDVNTFKSFFTTKRMELLHTIKHSKPKSIYELAKITKREYKNVYDDVELLFKLGLITKEKNTVDVDFNKLTIEVMV